MAAGARAGSWRLPIEHPDEGLLVPLTRTAGGDAADRRGLQLPLMQPQRLQVGQATPAWRWLRLAALDHDDRRLAEVLDPQLLFGGFTETAGPLHVQGQRRSVRQGQSAAALGIAEPHGLAREFGLGDSNRGAGAVLGTGAETDQQRCQQSIERQDTHQLSSQNQTALARREE